MRALPVSVLVVTTLTLAACQVFSGLDRLEVRDAGTKTTRTSAKTGPSRTLVDASSSEPKLAEGGMSHSPMIMSNEAEAGVGPSIANSAQPDAGVSAASDAGSPFVGAGTPSNGGSGAPEMDASMAAPALPADAGMPVDAAMMTTCTPPPPGQACTAAPQCGCDKTQNCAVLSDKLTCVTAGSVGENQACRAVADCAIGFECVAGACAKLCDPAHSDCSGGAKCIQLASSAGAMIAGAYFCESNCNLVDAQRADGELSACGPGLVCGFSGTGSRCAQGTRGEHTHGEACSDALACAPGYTCASDSGTCAKWCASASDCPSDFTCNTSTPVSVGQKSFGTCKPNCLDRTEQVCGLTTQCGCDAEHSCSVVSRSLGRVSHVCREVGPVRNYDSCTIQEDCVRGATCVDGTCRPNCLTDFDCERYASCDLSYLDQAPLVPALSTCSRPCDPADPYRAHGSYAACPSGRACEVVEDGYSYCRTASLRGTVGASCSDSSSCASGNTCISAGYCVQLCRGDSECNEGTCRAFMTAQRARDVEWGYCDIATNSMPQY